MISIKSDREIEFLRVAGNIVYETHQYLKQYIKPGITTLKLDKLAEDFIRSHGATPSFKGYNGFPGSICTSINHQVVHGIPSNTKLKKGDIISIDIGACYKGYHGDSAWTYPVGEVSVESSNLLKYTQEALFKGLSMVKEGNRIGDVSSAIEEVALKYHLGVVKELVGHGVGSKLHEDPEIPNYGVLAIEPMLNLGSSDIVICDDDWTIETVDYSPSAHFEHTVVVTSDGYEILTGVLRNG